MWNRLITIYCEYVTIILDTCFMVGNVYLWYYKYAQDEFKIICSAELFNFG